MAEDKITNAEYQAESHRRRYETANTKFIKVFGLALEVWDGSAAELQGRFKVPPGSSDSEQTVETPEVLIEMNFYSRWTAEAPDI